LLRRSVVKRHSPTRASEHESAFNRVAAYPSVRVRKPSVRRTRGA
jgi:hypothetical protein